MRNPRPQNAQSPENPGACGFGVWTLVLWFENLSLEKRILLSPNSLGQPENQTWFICTQPQHIRWRPYRNEYVGSLQNSETNRCRARIVLRWGTAREVLRVLPALLIFVRRAASQSQNGPQNGHALGQRFADRPTHHRHSGGDEPAFRWPSVSLLN